MGLGLGLLRRLRPAPRVTLHVGLPKCGSTSVQLHFARQAARYAAQGLIYPQAGREEAGYRSHRPLFHAGSDASPEGLQTMVQEIAREGQGARRILLSCEAFSDVLPDGLSGGPSGAVGAALAEEFGAKNVSVLAYFRNPVPWLESCYAQFLIGGLLNVPKPAFFASGPPDIARFVDAAEAAKGFAPYDYAAYAGAIAEAFAGLRLSCRSMARADLAKGSQGGDLLEDLCAHLGVRRQPGRPLANARKSAPSLLALQYVQTVFRQPVFDRRRALMRDFELSTAQDWPKDLRLQGLHISPERAAQIAERLHVNRAQIKEAFDTNIAGLVQFAPPAPLSQRALSAAEMDEVTRAFDPGAAGV